MLIDRGKHNILGVQVDAVNYEGALDRVLTAARNRQPFSASALAVHGVMTGVLDATHRHRLNRIDLVTPDGQPVRWAANLLHGAGLRERVYGPDFMLMLCRRAAVEELPIFLFGADGGLLERLRTRLVEQFPRLIVAGMRPSKFRTISPEEKQELARQRMDKRRDNYEEDYLTGTSSEQRRFFLSNVLKAVASALDSHTAFSALAHVEICAKPQAARVV